MQLVGCVPAVAAPALLLLRSHRGHARSRRADVIARNAGTVGRAARPARRDGGSVGVGHRAGERDSESEECFFHKGSLFEGVQIYGTVGGAVTCQRQPGPVPERARPGHPWTAGR